MNGRTPSSRGRRSLSCASLRSKSSQVHPRRRHGRPRRHRGGRGSAGCSRPRGPISRKKCRASPATPRRALPRGLCARRGGFRTARGRRPGAQRGHCLTEESRDLLVRVEVEEFLREKERMTRRSMACESRVSAKGATHKDKRIGRGEGSGKGGHLQKVKGRTKPCRL